jgi:uncharacterized protein (TIGR04222 family)
MSRKTLLPVLVALMALAVLAVAPVLAAKDYNAERFDVQFDLQPDGSALVTETVVFRFEGGPFTYAFRDIEPTETDGVTFIAASMDGDDMPPGASAGQVEVAGRDPLKVKWHFAPTSDTTREFAVRYRVDGVVRQLTADTIRWRAIPQVHDYPIDRSTITLTYPAAARLIEPPTLDREFESSPLPNGYRLTTNDIPADQDMILTARFAAGTAAASAPHWQLWQQQVEAATSRALPVGLLAAVATLILGGLGLFTYARAHRRDVSASTTMAWDTPPDDAPPALAAKLTRHSEGFMGTLFDLAQRGVLEVREDKGRWGSKKYTLELKNAAIPLSAHEQGLLSAVFKPGETTVEMPSIPTRLARKNKAFDEALEQELIERGWLDPDRKRQRRNLGVTGFLLLLATMSLFLLGLFGAGVALSTAANQTSLWAAILGAGAGGFVISLALLIYCAAFSPLTPDGEDEAARWKSFAHYLKQSSKNQQAVFSSDDFERYLPWAAAFGMGGAWARHFQRAGGAPLPVWFHAMPGSQGDFGAVVAAMSASDSTGASAAGGAGASGGGASGAG